MGADEMHWGCLYRGAAAAAAAAAAPAAARCARVAWRLRMHAAPPHAAAAPRPRAHNPSPRRAPSPAPPRPPCLLQCGGEHLIGVLKPTCVAHAAQPCNRANGTPATLRLPRQPAAQPRPSAAPPRPHPLRPPPFHPHAPPSHNHSTHPTPVRTPCMTTCSPPRSTSPVSALVGVCCQRQRQAGAAPARAKLCSSPPPPGSSFPDLPTHQTLCRVAHSCKSCCPLPPPPLTPSFT